MHVLLSGSPAAGEALRSRARACVLYGPLLTLAVGLCAALPVIAAAARGLSEGWQPVADRGIIATRAFDVFSAHTPLVGQYSFAGTVTGKVTYSLGPLLYWLLAPAAHVGAPASFVLTMAIANTACVLGAVALARRRGGFWLMVVAAAGIGVMCRSLAANNFYDIWNPSAGLFPLLALIFCCWSLACGDYRLLPVTLLLGSFELQCEDSFIPTSLGALAVGIVGLSVWWLRMRRELPRRRRRSVGRWVAAGVLVLAACWSAPVIDQIAHSGNLKLAEQAASQRKSPLGGGVGVHAVIRTVGVVPWWLKREPEPFVRKFDVRHGADTVTGVSAALMLAWLLLAIALAVRRRRADVVAGAATALMLCAGIYSIAAATPRAPLLAATLGYTLWSATTVGMFVWLIALWAAVVLSGAEEVIARSVSARLRRGERRTALRRLPAAVAGLTALLLAGLAGGAGASAGAPDEHAFEFAALREINAHLGAVPRGHSVFLNARLDGLITPLRPELTYDLRRRGVRALGNGAYLRTGHWYERAEHPYDYIVWVYDNGRLPAVGARVIADARIRSGGRLHTIDVAVSRAPPRASRAGRAAAPPPASSAPRASASAGGWAAAGSLSACPLSAPAIAYPSAGPADPTGPGAIVWSGGGAPCGGGPARLVAGALGTDGRVVSSSSVSLPAAGGGRVQAVGASFGRLAIAVAPQGAASPPLLLQARAGHPLGAPLMRGTPGAQFAIARAYLGDVAVATVVSGPAIAVRVERFFRHGFGPRQLVPIGPGRVSALTVTLDYRSDVLLAWQQDGAVYAHMLRASGRADPTQKVGPSAPDPQLRALVSDNDHGMLAWTSTAGPGASGAAATGVYLSLSGAGVRFHAPRLLASFADPLAAGRLPGSLQLVRLSSENVLVAWSAREGGRYAVRAAPAVFAGTRPSVRLSAASSDAVLADLAPGPAGEAVAVWRSTPARAGGGSGLSRLWAARTFIAAGDRPGFTGVQQLPAGAASAAAAVDPASDRPVVAWVQGAAGLRYAVGPRDAHYRPHIPPLPSPAPSATHWLRITIAALAGLALAAGAAALGLRRRARRRLALRARR